MSALQFVIQAMDTMEQMSIDPAMKIIEELNDQIANYLDNK